MKLTLESTSTLADVVTASGTVPARVWRGRTEGGVECFAYITRIAVNQEHDTSQFERELLEYQHEDLGQISIAIPLRLIL